jgi:hypothetical protein
MNKHPGQADVSLRAARGLVHQWRAYARECQPGSPEHTAWTMAAQQLAVAYTQP